ncbi:MAG: sigma-70 family RNA polymerase sigma factor [Chloroflexi bacterium]|nr:sigma-70 family RNA polymerase sigma factor [Chloroflexota bacterium]
MWRTLSDTRPSSTFYRRSSALSFDVIDAPTFARLYSYYVDKIFKYVYNKIGKSVEAEDLTAQVFMKAWQAIGRYRRTEYPFSAWLFKIAHNLVVDYFRTRREVLSIERLPFEIDAGNDSLDMMAQRTLTAADLRKAIAQLTEAQRQVIVLKFLEGYSTEETARIISKDKGAVRALQHRALLALKQACDAEYGSNSSQESAVKQ